MNESDSCYGQEVELKLRVPSAEALQAIAKAAGGESLGTALQRNVFFDTPDFALHHARFGLRLRDEDGHFTVTAKSPETLSEDGTVASRGEADRCTSRAARRRIRQRASAPTRGDRSAFRPGGDHAGMRRDDLPERRGAPRTGDRDSVGAGLQVGAARVASMAACR